MRRAPSDHNGHNPGTKAQVSVALQPVLGRKLRGRLAGAGHAKRAFIHDLFDSDEEFQTSFRRAEYRMALADAVLPGSILNPAPGLYTGDFHGNQDGLVWEQDFRQDGDREARKPWDRWRAGLAPRGALDCRFCSSFSLTQALSSESCSRAAAIAAGEGSAACSSAGQGFVGVRSDHERLG